MFALSLMAELSGVTELRPLDEFESPYLWTFRVICTSCREIHPKWVSVSRWDMDEMESSRGGANFIWRCKFCKRESSALIKGDPAPYIESSPPQRQRLLEIDCRGLEFIEFKPLGQWQAKGLESYTHFPEIDLGEGEWYDYDEKAGQEVSVKDMEWFIIRD